MKVSGVFIFNGVYLEYDDVDDFYQIGHEKSLSVIKNFFEEIFSRQDT